MAADKGAKQAPEGAGDTARRLLELRFPAAAVELQAVRRAVREVLAPCCTEQEICCAVLAVNEACMNIIQHAYGEEEQGEIILQIYDAGEALLFRLIDFAEPVDLSKIRSRCLEELRPGGLGVHLMNSVMDECTFLKCPDGVGNVFQMVKKKRMRRNDDVSDA